jgi:diazepam-binding inhibitor (GABA receptor modulator, acyl-CoA-binding protein)
MKEWAAMSLEEQFLSAQQRVNNLSRRPSDLQLLEIYGLYKQASLGDVTGNRPGGFDFKGRAKWEAWKQRQGLSPEEAMKRYVEVVERLERELG